MDAASGFALDVNARIARSLLSPNEKTLLASRVQQLTESRAETVDTQAAEIRRIERDLHDGAQARLVALGINLGLAEDAVENDPENAKLLLAEARAASSQALAEIRGLVRGIHPPVLADRGLVGAVQALALASPVPGADRGGGPRPAARPGRVGVLLRRRRGAHQRDQAQRRTRARGCVCATRTGCCEMVVRDDGRGGAAAGRRHRPSRNRATPRRVRWQAHGDQPARRADHRDHGAAVRVVLAEDLALLRDGLIRLLEANDFDVVEAVDNGPSLLRALTTHRPDVAVVDVRLPPTFTDEGLRAAIEARKQVPGLPILVLSQYVEQLYARELLADRSGGVGYLLKDRVFNIGQFVDAVRQVAGGGTAMDPEVISQLLTRRADDAPIRSLTPRERDVLELMAEGRSNAAIAARLFITEKAVSKHTNSIFSRLGLPPSEDDNRRVLAVLAYLNG